MRRLQERANALPPRATYFVTITVVYSGLSFLFPTSGSSRSVVRSIIGGVFFGAAMTIVARVMRRRDRKAAGGVDLDQASVARALRTGDAPADRLIHPALLGLINRRRRQLRWASRVNPWLFGGSAALTLPLAFQHHLYLAYAAFFLGCAVCLRMFSKRSELRLDRLEAHLLADRYE